ncbi:MAG TPA: hypothetical protein DIT76_05740 [Spartobacteria bacterium]|jgi:hypothetical protein|nr:hypothetical protein [Spartobacteria bacterium]HCP91534.1 hypothetical protein [Spartobacteria bacterium]
MHKHLRRLERVWIEPAIYFVTTCTKDRKEILATHETAAALIDEWHSARERHGWVIGRYVIMPDHVHFFCVPEWKQRRYRTSLAHGNDGPVEEFTRCEVATRRLLPVFRGQRPRLQPERRFGSANSSIMCCGQRKATTTNGIMSVTIRCALVWLLSQMTGPTLAS